MLAMFLRILNNLTANLGNRKKKQDNQLSASTFGAWLTRTLYLITKPMMWESSSKCHKI